MRSQLNRAWVEIDLGALRRNGAAVAARTGARLLPMVKADAYGTGALAAVRALEPLDPWGYGVATIDEGVELKSAGVTHPICIFTPLVPEELPDAKHHGLRPVLGDRRTIAKWRELGGGAWHLGIDTGMHRAGTPWRDVAALRELIASHPPEGVCTHFHSAELEDDTMAEQERRFDEALRELPTSRALTHAENSAAIVRRGRSKWDLVRPGIFLYGVGSGAARQQPEPVVSIRARIVELHDAAAGEAVSYSGSYHCDHDRRVATLPIGYADGYMRALGNRAVTLVRGRPAPVCGVVTMDMTMIDVTGIECDVGDVVTLVGRDGDERVELDHIATAANVSPYELLTSLRGRLGRVYREAPEA